MAKDINKEPFDETTLTKLEIFEQYLVAWLPVFIQTPHTDEVMICDFCAGSGQDSKGELGSPLRILHTIEKYRDHIFEKNITIHVVLNEAKPRKFVELQNAVRENFDQNMWREKVTVKCCNDEFQVLFGNLYSKLQRQPNLLFIDQYGIKEVTTEVFQKLVALKKTDFLFFMSSSYMKRFAKKPDFKAHFPDIDSSLFVNAKHEDVHRIMLNYYKDKIPADNRTRLYPFTLKKGANIYGLIFGSKHPLGVEKFLGLAWDQNKINGEANFDIDDDISKQQPMLFSEMERPTKREAFQVRLEEFINDRGEVTNRDVYDFTLDRGHPTAHARESIARLRRENKIECDGNIGFSYKSCVNKASKTIKATPHG